METRQSIRKKIFHLTVVLFSGVTVLSPAITPAELSISSPLHGLLGQRRERLPGEQVVEPPACILAFQQHCALVVRCRFASCRRFCSAGYRKPRRGLPSD